MNCLSRQIEHIEVAAIGGHKLEGLLAHIVNGQRGCTYRKSQHISSRCSGKPCIPRLVKNITQSFNLAVVVNSRLPNVVLIKVWSRGMNEVSSGIVIEGRRIAGPDPPGEVAPDVDASAIGISMCANNLATSGL